ncbi:hypothetical protein B0T20DRAFT_162342 [Sordaria brevicollis]|uniref:Uncharacterized protein n=1 Tax=Sordaria brevicollis TaxID=83679 RepID=A0AAE0PJW0_SORBR|nr:hypothetical protein B0T20DRAFT_162342 [Sordaria brevicollis]
MQILLSIAWGSVGVSDLCSAKTITGTAVVMAGQYLAWLGSEFDVRDDGDGGCSFRSHTPTFHVQDRFDLARASFRVTPQTTTSRKSGTSRNRGEGERTHKKRGGVTSCGFIGVSGTSLAIPFWEHGICGRNEPKIDNTDDKCISLVRGDRNLSAFFVAISWSDVIFFVGLMLAPAFKFFASFAFASAMAVATNRFSNHLPHR